MPEPIDDRIFKQDLHRRRSASSTRSRADPDHEVRRTIDTRVRGLRRPAPHDPALLAKGEELKRELLDHPEVRAWLESLWMS